MSAPALDVEPAVAPVPGGAASPTQVRTAGRHRPYLYEVDLVRVVTALCVVGVHAAAFTVVFNHSTLGAQLQNAVVDVLHFTREVFLSITAFVLVYGYAHRPFNARRFWRRRGLGVLLPYVAWSFFYVWFSTPHQPIGSWLWAATLNTIGGSASYQLYFILLSLEFYLILPLFLWALARVERHPWKLLAGSLAVQLAVMYVDYHYIQAGALAGTRAGQVIAEAQGRLLPFYQFYAVIGALGAIYVDQVRAFVLRHGRAVVVTMALGVGILWGRYFVGVWSLHDSTDYATAVFQPSVVLFSGATALFLYWLGSRWALSRGAGMRPRGWRFMALLSDASFGVYLVHAFILNSVLSSLAPAFPAGWPAAFRALLVWAIAASGAVGMSVLFIYLPGFSRLVGRPCAWTGAVIFLRRVGAWLRQPLDAALRPLLAQDHAKGAAELDRQLQSSE
ncbi:MAG TPA: acyltransferase [Thermomicrobiaceae bacterium]|nr:acyltransferase [Thermomicrobiaceae bacterium]